jgi:glycosyltransferase involved in cell wall biosynthesis
MGTIFPMRIAFYAPLKPPDHPAPSGDRTMARLLIQALRLAGARVEIASRLRARVAGESEIDQRRMAGRGQAIAQRLVRKYRRQGKTNRPRAWFTYHLYYKAVDWVGPTVAKALDIPYLVAEASHAPKRLKGAFAFSALAAEKAISEADLIFCLNPSDRECLAPITGQRRLVDLPPFLDIKRFAPALPDRAAAKLKLWQHFNLDPGQPWLIAVAMMRAGDKLASYRLLADALRHVRHPYQIILVGDGPARAEVEHAFAGLKRHVAWAGLQPRAALPEFYSAADLLVWPAINEAFGMALIEAQACGCPIVAGASGGIPAIVADGKTGFLSLPGDAIAFAADIDHALGRNLSPMRKAARELALAKHDLPGAADTLRRSLVKLGIGKMR